MTGHDTDQQRINGYWNKYAVAYDSHQLERQQRSDVVEAWKHTWTTALPPAPANVLDVGTGSGNVALLVAGIGHRVTGIDLAEGMLAEARRKAAGTQGAPDFRLADAAAPPFPDASFDAITARYVLWTLRDPLEALGHWIRLLRPGGVLVAVDSPWYPDGINAAPAATQRERDFRTAYDGDVLARLPLAQASDIQETARLLEKAGFLDVTVTELTEILKLDHRDGVAPGHRPQMQYRITARTPAVDDRR